MVINRSSMANLRAKVRATYKIKGSVDGDAVNFHFLLKGLISTESSSIFFNYFFTSIGPLRYFILIY